MLGVVVLATMFTLVHCASQDDDDAAPEADGGGNADATATDAGADADADGGATDASTDDEFDVPDGAVVCDAAPCAVAVAGGFGTKSAATFCALLDDGTLQCWGTNQQLRLGYTVDGGGPIAMSSSPHRVPTLSGVTSVSIAGDNGCATDAAGKVSCWGVAAIVNSGRDPDAGAPFTAAVLPTPLDLVPTASSVALGGMGTACVTTKAGTISCWGKSDRAELARKTTAPLSPPSEIPIGGHTDLSAWPGHSWMFATTTSGEVFSWGAGVCSNGRCDYMLGRDSSEDIDPVPTLVPSLANVRAIASSVEHVCAIAGRYVECWGDNSQGKLGRGYVSALSEFPGKTTLSLVTAADDADAGISDRGDVPLQLAADRAKTCAVMGSGRIYCWGPIGADRTQWGHPTRVEGLSGPAVAVALAVTTSCALLRSGVVECWGGNIFGALGRGNDDITFTDPLPAAVHFPDE